MEDKGLYFRVGLAILAGVAALLALVVWIGADTFRRRGFMFETYFAESVQGLDSGAQVRFRGVAIGTVREIAIAAAVYPEAMRGDIPRSEGARLVVVRFELFRDRLVETSVQQFHALVESGLRLRMASQGITGILYLEMDFLDPARFPPLIPPWPTKYPVIPAVPSTLAQFQSAAERLMARLNEVDFPGLVERIGALVDALTESVTVGEGYRLLVEGGDLLASLRRQSDAIGPRLEAAALEAERTARGLREIAESRELRGILANTAAASTELRNALARLPATLAATEQTIRRVEALVGEADRDLGPALRDLRLAADNLRALTEQARRYPSQMLFGEPPPGAAAPLPGGTR
ncbi:MAG: MlaD family protein [Elioraea sp.]|nr:MlaD family protein [Elioraea sp.]